MKQEWWEKDHAMGRLWLEALLWVVGVLAVWAVLCFLILLVTVGW